MTVLEFEAQQATLICQHCGGGDLVLIHNPNNHGIRPQCRACGSKTPLAGTQWLSQQGDAMAYTSLPFGKHKDVPIDDVPVDYLTWFLKNMDNIRPATRKMIDDSLARRQAGGTTKASSSANGHDTTGGIPCPACGAMLRVSLGEAMVPDDDKVPF